METTDFLFASVIGHYGELRNSNVCRKEVIAFFGYLDSALFTDLNVLVAR